MAKTEDKRKHKNCSLCADKVEAIDYKDAAKLRRYLTEAGKIIPRRITGNCAKHQRMIAKAIKQEKLLSSATYLTNLIRKQNSNTFLVLLFIIIFPDFGQKKESYN